MEEEMVKRNTDCVYFLASPFTCKKGAECEYRHSEMARLNPQDCWFWRTGTCLNPTCAFRHPPLDVHTEATSKASASLVSQPSVPATKNTVPCYFYLKGFCRRGDRCPFVHEPNEIHSLKPMVANTVSDIPIYSLETKTSRSDLETVPAKNNRSLFEMAIKSSDGFQALQKQLAKHQASNAKLALSTSAQALALNCEETAVVDAAPSQHVELSPKSDCEPILDSDQISEELIDGDIARDEWCESSPGFDVLVDGKAEDLDYEDDPEYLCDLNRNDGDRKGLLIQHGVDHNDYDERLFFRDGLYNSSELIYDEHRADLEDSLPSHTLDRVGGRVSHKRKLLSVDLRNYLRKRRMVDGYLETNNWRHIRSDDRQERHPRHGFKQQLHGRLVSKSGRKVVGSAARKKNLAVEAHPRGKRSNSLRYKSRRSDNGMRQPQLANESKRQPSVRRECEPSVSITFDGPKSLAEIKEERRKGWSGRNGSVDFDGPKPLSEILKAKRQT